MKVGFMILMTFAMVSNVFSKGGGGGRGGGGGGVAREGGETIITPYVAGIMYTQSDWTQQPNIRDHQLVEKNVHRYRTATSSKFQEWQLAQLLFLFELSRAVVSHQK